MIKGDNADEFNEKGKHIKAMRLMKRMKIKMVMVKECGASDKA